MGEQVPVRMEWNRMDKDRAVGYNARGVTRVLLIRQQVTYWNEIIV